MSKVHRAHRGRSHVCPQGRLFEQDWQGHRLFQQSYVIILQILVPLTFLPTRLRQSTMNRRETLLLKLRKHRSISCTTTRRERSSRRRDLSDVHVLHVRPLGRMLQMQRFMYLLVRTLTNTASCLKLSRIVILQPRYTLIQYMLTKLEIQIQL